MIRFITADQVRELLPPSVAYESQVEAFTALGSGRTPPAPRVMIEGVRGASAFSLTASLAPGAAVVNKFGAIHPDNLDRGLSAVSALVIVLDPETGRAAAIMDGTVLTELRTAAASAVAAVAIAPAATEILVLGTGVQGAAHLRSLAFSHPGAQLALWGRDQHKAEQVAAEVLAELGRAVAVRGHLTAAVPAADLVVACTSSSTPLFAADLVAAGSTVISIGSFARDRTELEADLLGRCAAVVVDDRGVALEHAGSVIQAVSRCLIQPDDLRELGEVLVGGRSVRRRSSEIVSYFSVGVGVQDAAAATAVARAAEEQNVGRLIAL